MRIFSPTPTATRQRGPPDRPAIIAALSALTFHHRKRGAYAQIQTGLRQHLQETERVLHRLLYARREAGLRIGQDQRQGGGAETPTGSLRSACGRPLHWSGR